MTAVCIAFVAWALLVAAVLFVPALARIVGAVVLILIVITAAACAEERRPHDWPPVKNVQTMIQAARTLKFSVPENRAFILEKQEVYVGEVAVIFGYADNRFACQEIADILNASRRAGTFKCHPIH
jgi:hypothetical protein